VILSFAFNYPIDRSKGKGERAAQRPTREEEEKKKERGSNVINRRTFPNREKRGSNRGEGKKRPLKVCASSFLTHLLAQGKG